MSAATVSFSPRELSDLQDVVAVQLAESIRAYQSVCREGGEMGARLRAADFRIPQLEALAKKLDTLDSLVGTVEAVEGVAS